MKYLVKDLEATKKVAADFATDLLLMLSKNGATIVGLYGELGSGKTSFTQGLARALGVSDTVVSPTFVIEKIYNLELMGRPFFHLIHIDAYRLEKSSELLNLGWPEITADPKNLILIEWPERVSDIMPEHIKIHFKHIENEQREIEIERV